MNAQQTYSKIQKETLSGRDIEARVLQKAASQFRYALDTDAPPERMKRTEAAVRYNLRVWDVFHADWDSTDCPLTLALRTDLLRLSVYVHKTSLEILAYDDPAKIRSLININDCLIRGLTTARVPQPEAAVG